MMQLFNRKLFLTGFAVAAALAVSAVILRVWEARMSVLIVESARRQFGERGIRLSVGKHNFSLLSTGICWKRVEFANGNELIAKAGSLSVGFAFRPALKGRIVLEEISASELLLKVSTLEKMRQTAGGRSRSVVPGGTEGRKGWRVDFSDRFSVRLEGVEVPEVTNAIGLSRCDARLDRKADKIAAGLDCEAGRRGEPAIKASLTGELAAGNVGIGGRTGFSGNADIAFLRIRAADMTSPLEYSGRLEWKAEADMGALRSVALKDINIQLNGVSLKAEATILGLPSDPEVDLSATLPLTSFASLSRLFPQGMLPDGVELEKEGGAEAWLKAKIPAARMADMELDGALSIKKPRDGLAFLRYLKGAFDYQPPQQNGNPKPQRIHVGPLSQDFVALPDVPYLFIHALLIREDFAFHGHHGFDFSEMREAIVTDLERRERARGASTITQQLAKNLFLTKEKTILRKAVEAFYAAALEATLTKERILEMYLNIIEWGPAIFGLRPAARHYFGKEPCELTLKEMAFLVSIIPNPIFYHGYCSKGEISPRREEQLIALFDKMLLSGIISPELYEEAVAEKLKFQGCSFRKAPNGEDAGHGHR